MPTKKHKEATRLKKLTDVDNIATPAIAATCGVGTRDLEVLRMGEPGVEDGIVDESIHSRILIQLVQRITEMDQRIKALEGK